MLAVLLFTAGSVLCATATSIEMLVAFRVLQGLGGGMLMPVGMTIMTRAAGPDRVGRVMAVLGVPMLLGPIFGPILGGWLIDIASWHWIFLINVPIGAGALLYAAKVLPEGRGRAVGERSTSSACCCSRRAWRSSCSASPRSRVKAPCSAARVLVVGGDRPGPDRAVRAPVAVAVQLEHPLVDLHLFRNPRLTVAVIAMALFAIAFFGASLLFPQYFLLTRHETTLSAGLLLAPQGIGAMITMPACGVLTDRIGPGKIVLSGIVVIVIGMAMFTQVGVDASDVAASGDSFAAGSPSYLYLIAALFIMGLGMGGTMMPIMTAALQTLKDHEIARASTLMNITQQVAASIGTALFSVLLTNGFNDVDAATTPQGAISRDDRRLRGLLRRRRRSWSPPAWCRRTSCRAARRPSSSTPLR